MKGTLTALTIHGKIAREAFGVTIPVHRSPYSLDTPHFDGVSMIRFDYRTDGRIAAEILPDELELDDQPIASVSFISYGRSAVGRYREVVQSVEVTYRGERFTYVPHIYVTSDAAMIAGREWLAYPKLIADIEWGLANDDHNALPSARIERPTGITLAAGVFNPERHEGRVENLASRQLTLKVHPSTAARRQPAFAEYVETTAAIVHADLWTGNGTVCLTGMSDRDPLHKIPVVQPLGAAMFSDALITLNPAQTFPLRPAV